MLLDALEPFGFGHVFPRGMLREPVDGLRRADVVILSRADLLDPAERAALWQTVRRYAPQAAGAEVIHAPRRLISAAGAEMPLGLRAGAVGGRFLRPRQSGRLSAYAGDLRLPRRRAFGSSPTITNTRRPTSMRWRLGPPGSMPRPCCAPARTWSSCRSIAWAAARFGRWTSSWSFSPGKRHSSRNCRRCY